MITLIKPQARFLGQFIHQTTTNLCELSFKFDIQMNVLAEKREIYQQRNKWMIWAEYIF